MLRQLTIASLCMAALAASAIDISEINIRDPFVYANPADSTYYLYRSKSPAWNIGAERGGVQVFKSKDLKTWSEPVQVLEVPADNWATGTIWAPEMHPIAGRYYMFATVNDTIQWKKPAPGNHNYTQRGTQIFVADSPEGPFTAFDDKLPATPMGAMCLDGTYFSDRGRHYMVYCPEWVELIDGTVELLELSPDMRPCSTPTRLFCGSAAKWSTGGGNFGGEKTYVTDGVFLYRSPSSGNLYMIWSSFHNGSYAIGVARSKTGHITGPWIQQNEPMMNRDGGHGMIFTGFDGQPRLILHGPNSPEGAERARIFTISDNGETLVLTGETTGHPAK